MPNRATAAAISVAISAIVVDDEKLASDELSYQLREFPDVEVIATASNGIEAVQLIMDLEPDLVFLDVQMPDMDGFAVLEAIPRPHDFHVVFLTAHEHHALRAFAAEALDYLLKPADPERFERALERAKEQIALRRERAPKLEPARYLKRILVEKNGREIFLPVERLDWAESDRNYVRLHAGGEEYAIRETLENLAKQLDPEQFARISRSELVNLDRVREMQPWFHGERRIVLQDGRQLIWTRRFRASSTRAC
jgi:two-component system LytT family response regulator